MSFVLNDILVGINNLVWGVPLIVLIMATGIYLTLRLDILQIRYIGKALRHVFKNESKSPGEVSSFSALCTALSATVGTGNIVGVATAIVAGGPGALFWMWLAAFFGMATKYAEGFLAIRYREITPEGKAIGGPFYYIEKGMGKKYKPLAVIFAIFGVGVGLLGIGTFSQVNSISSAVNNFFDPSNAWTVDILGATYSWTVVIAGVLLTFFVGLVIVGGLRRIAHVASVIVPFMAIIYVAASGLIILLNIDRIPSAVIEILESAFGMRAVAGGALGAMIVAMQKGIARGIFSNEAGLGSAPIASAAAKSTSPVRQGLISMTGTFIDTIVICTMTGLCIVVTGSWNIGLEGVAVTTQAFVSGLPFAPTLASFVLMLCLIFFAFTTIIGWNFYSERCLSYLSNDNKTATHVFRLLFLAAVFIGPYFTVEEVWNIADILNGLMAFPNLIALLFLSPVIAAETRKILTRRDRENPPEDWVDE